MGLTADLIDLAVMVTARCQGCGACLLTCPEHAIRPSHAVAEPGIGPLTVLSDACTGCGECVEVCPVDAIEELATGAAAGAFTGASAAAPVNGTLNGPEHWSSE